MSDKGRKQFLEAVAENQQVVQYVKLFRMPLFLTVLDDELERGKCREGDSLPGHAGYPAAVWVSAG